MFSISLLFFESGTYGSIWLYIVQLYAEKVVARYEPQQQFWVGVMTPRALLKIDRYERKVAVIRLP